jgi:hypothetical protein
MKDDPTTIDTLFDRVKEFSIAYAELLKLKAIDLAGEFISTILPDAVFSALILIVLLFISLGLAFWIGEITGRVYIGFLLVGGIYLLIGMISRLFFRDWFRKRIQNYFVRNIFRNTDL